MGSAVIGGCINENKKDDSAVYTPPENNLQFVSDIILSKNLSEIVKMRTKSPDEIKEELDKKEDR